MFNANDMEVYCDSGGYILEDGGHGHIFCSAVQFASWLRRLRACMEEAEEGAGEAKVFVVEQMPLFNSCDYGNYLQDPRLKRL